jgi:hypothetical protein
VRHEAFLILMCRDSLAVSSSLALHVLVVALVYCSRDQLGSLVY